MVIKTNIQDGLGKGTTAGVTARGQLVVAPIDYSLAYNNKAEVVDTAYNLVAPKKGKRFVITEIVLVSNYLVGVNGAAVDLYEATSEDTITISKSILQMELLKNSTFVLTGINLIISEGRWVNLKTDDDDVFATIMGYYVNS